MVVYGGFGPGGVRPQLASDIEPQDSSRRTQCGLLGSIHLLDLATKAWSDLTVGTGSPDPVKSHSAVAYKSKMIVFGGSVPLGRTNAVRVFD
jgi:hypothetical protein